MHNIDLDTTRQELIQTIATLSHYREQSTDHYEMAFDLIGHLIPFKPQSAVAAYDEVLKTAEFNNTFTETITPRATALFEQFSTIDIKGVVEQAMDSLMSYTRHHYTEQETVFKAAGDTIARRAQATSQHDSKSVVPLATKLIDTASIYKEHFQEAFVASWTAVAKLHPSLTDDCHAIVYRTYGVAERGDALDLYVNAGREVMPEIVRLNKNNAVLAARALEQASIELVTGSRLPQPEAKPFITPAFARTGELSGENEARWFFPTQDGRGDKAVITLVPGLFDGATEEPSPPRELPERDAAAIRHVRDVFADVARGIMPVERAAERIAAPAAHLALKPWR